MWVSGSDRAGRSCSGGLWVPYAGFDEKDGASAEPGAKLLRRLRLLQLLRLLLMLSWSRLPLQPWSP